MHAAAPQVEPPEDIEVPQSLLPDEVVDSLVAERQPRFVPLARFGPDSDPLPPPDAATGRQPFPLWTAVLHVLVLFHSMLSKPVA